MLSVSSLLWRIDRALAIVCWFWLDFAYDDAVYCSPWTLNLMQQTYSVCAPHNRLQTQDDMSTCLVIRVRTGTLDLFSIVRIPRMGKAEDQALFAIHLHLCAELECHLEDIGELFPKLNPLGRLFAWM